MDYLPTHLLYSFGILIVVILFDLVNILVLQTNHFTVIELRVDLFFFHAVENIHTNL
jgi:hypothetical protein